MDRQALEKKPGPRWVWPFAFSLRTRERAYRAAGVAEPLCRGWRWPLAAAGAGALPFLLSWSLALPGHQALSAAALTLLCLACVRSDSWLEGLGIVTVAYVVHCAAVIAVARFDYQGAALVLPDAEAYWVKQAGWIRTGQDPEYELLNWLPAHAQLLFGALFYAYLSLGSLVFYQGFYEVDLMNFYNAQLMNASVHQPVALGAGWHVWSWLRGAGYLFLCYEVTSLSLRQMTGRALSTGRRRAIRWGLGLGFVAADCVVKLLMLDAVRNTLLNNLKAD